MLQVRRQIILLQHKDNQRSVRRVFQTGKADTSSLGFNILYPFVIFLFIGFLSISQSVSYALVLYLPELSAF